MTDHRFAPPMVMLGFVFLAMAAPINLAAPLDGACREIDPMDAHTRGTATVLTVREVNTGLDESFAASSNVQQGPGMGADDATLPDVQVPPGDGSIATLGGLESRVEGTVVESPLTSTQRSQARVESVDLLGGLIRAELVDSDGTGFSTSSSALTYTNDAAFGEVVIDGKGIVNIGPNTKVPLDDHFGPGSHVVLFERIDDSTFPHSGHPFYTADLTVRMIHVVIPDSSDLPGEQGLEIIVAESTAFAETPTPFCGPEQSVGASAYVARVRTEQDLSRPGTLIGWIQVPPTGGDMKQVLTEVDNNESALGFTAASAETRAFGHVELGVQSKSHAVAKISDLCIQGDDTGCLVTAQEIRSESQSRAYPDTAYSWGHTRIANLVIQGTDVCQALGMENPCKPAKNQKLTIGNTTVLFNERYRDPWSPGNTGYTVRAVRIEGPEIGIVILGRSYSEAHYEPETFGG